jgi:hypothetical protein
MSVGTWTPNLEVQRLIRPPESLWNLRVVDYNIQTWALQHSKE